LKVTDLEKSLTFCRDTLNFSETMRLNQDNGDA